MKDDPYVELKEHFAGVTEVSVNAGPGAQGIKLGKKMFAMFYKGDLLLQLAPVRVSELIASGEGLAFDPGTGTPVADRVLVTNSQTTEWIPLAEESRDYARTRA